MGAVSFSSFTGKTEVLNLQNEYTVQQIINKILESIPNAPYIETVDTIKTGNPQAIVKGIVTTTFATIDVINKAIEIGANFIIVHEPIFYNHADEKGWLENDAVFQYKESLLEQHEISVWRFHDYLHAHKPDGVLSGIVDSLEWQEYNNTEKPGIIEIKPTSLQNIIEHVKSRLHIPMIKYIGDPADDIKKIVLLPGAWGGKNQIATIAKHKPDLTIVGEINEWETSEYIRDLRAITGKGSLIILGHAVSEEPGMKWMEEWLQPKIPGIKVTHIPSNDPFDWG